jgi:hypothetical protein
MKLRHAAALALMLAPMVGCWSAYHKLTGPTDSETYTADGLPGYTIHCDGALLSWGSCAAKAGELCETRGYDIIDRHTWGFPISRTMLVACKRPSETRPLSSAK